MSLKKRRIFGRCRSRLTEQDLTRDALQRFGQGPAKKAAQYRHGYTLRLKKRRD